MTLCYLLSLTLLLLNVKREKQRDLLTTENCQSQRDLILHGSGGGRSLGHEDACFLFPPQECLPHGSFGSAEAASYLPL